MDTSSGFLALISGAVTPVVMISACAILTTGVGSRHTELSDRIRALAAEYRATSNADPRRLTVQGQLRAFMRRGRLTWLAHCFLYVAAADFAAAVLTALHALRRSGWGLPTVVVFVLGTVLLLIALLLMLCELFLAQKTLDWEAEDVLASQPVESENSATNYRHIIRGPHRPLAGSRPGGRVNRNSKGETGGSADETR